MKNPFEKLFGRNSQEATEDSLVENSSEQKRVSESDFDMRDDGIYVREIYDDGSVGEWELLKNAPADNAQIAREVYIEWRKARGLTEIKEESQE